MSRRIAYLDCFSGASGDMLLGALLDAGLALCDLEADLAALDLGEYELRLTRQQRRGITGSKFEVVDQAQERHLHALRDIRSIIDGGALPAEVSAPSVAVLERLAKAEAVIHGVPLEEVHFHEVGALDTIVDIVGFCSALHRLGIAALYASPLPLGSGVVRTQHGLLPVPAPATLALLAAVGAPVVAFPADNVSAEGELVTPTGAAILATLAVFGRPAMRVQQVGYGLGSKDFPWANILRVWIGEAEPDRGGSAFPSTEQGHKGAHERAHADQHEH